MRSSLSTFCSLKQALKDADVYSQRGEQSLQRVVLEKAVSVYQGDLLPGSYDGLD